MRKDPDVSALSSLDGHKLRLFLWHYHDDDVAGPTALVRQGVFARETRRGVARIQDSRAVTELRTLACGAAIRAGFIDLDGL